MSDENVYFRNDKALNARIDKLEADFKRRVEAAENAAEQATKELAILKQLWSSTVAGRGSGPTA